MTIHETWLNAHLYSGDVCLDLGSNEGTWALQLRKQFKEVYCVEPIPQLADFLIRRRFPTITGLLAGQGGFLRPLHVYANTELSATTPRKDQDKPEYTFYAPTFRLDEVVRSFGIGPGRVDFVKVDIEGDEGEVLADTRFLFAAHRPDMIIEIHSENNGLQVEDVLRRNDYLFDVVRHPRYIPGSEEWGAHYWMVTRRPVADQTDKAEAARPVFDNRVETPRTERSAAASDHQPVST